MSDDRQPPHFTLQNLASHTLIEPAYNSVWTEEAFMAVDDFVMMFNLILPCILPCLLMNQARLMHYLPKTSLSNIR